MTMQPTTPPEPPKHDRSPLGLVWVTCPYYPGMAAGLEKTLGAKALVHRGQEPPEDAPSLVVLCANVEDVAPEVRHLKALAPDSPVLVLGPHAELPLARAALRSGARGFIHAQMPPEQVVRALEVASKGETVIPRELIKALLEAEALVDPDVLTPRQREVLELVAGGLSNAQIAQRLFLSESTIKQHLRNTYKVLGVKNRAEAATVFRRSKQLGAADATAPSE